MLYLEALVPKTTQLSKLAASRVTVEDYQTLTLNQPPRA